MRYTTFSFMKNNLLIVILNTNTVRTKIFGNCISGLMNSRRAINLALTYKET